MVAKYESKEKCEEVCRKCEVEEGQPNITGFIFMEKDQTCRCHHGTVDEKEKPSEPIEGGIIACFFGMPFSDFLFV